MALDLRVCREATRVSAMRARSNDKGAEEGMEKKGKSKTREETMRQEEHVTRKK